jgi:hypothetical protein
MYKLFDYDVFSLIDESYDEGDIIETMSKLMSKSVGQRFFIEHIDEKTNIPETTSIRNVRDYYNYVLDYNDRLKNMSCVELKESILERNKPKTRKLSK